jgi:multidrug efflux pump subunit AcrA (membrane-fusion protein)
MRATESVDVRARVEGFLEQIHFKDSDDVNMGDLLFTIEQEPFEAGVAQANAQLESAQADLARTQADLNRVEEAVETGAVSEQEVDLRRAERDIATAAVSQARAALVDAELLLGYTKVTSPIDGRTSRQYVDVGNLVGSGEKTLLTRVVKLDPMHVYFDMSESLLLKFLKRAEETGRRRRQTDVKFHVALADEDDYVHIRVKELEETPSLLIRESAIGTDLGGKFLLILGENNIIQRRYVQLGQLFGQMRAIREGIQPNESYVASGIQRARPGLPATPKEEAAQNPEPSNKPASKSQEN